MSPRIWQAFAANGFGQAVTLGTQLATFPLFLSHWTSAELGTWLMLSAAASYFSLADGGVLGAARNRMAILSGEGRWAECETTFRNAIFLVLSFTALAAVAATMLVLLSSMGPLATMDGKVAVVLLIGTVVLTVSSGLVEGIYRISDKFSESLMALNIGRLLEWLGGAVGLITGGGYLHVAAGMFCTRVAVTAVLLLRAGRLRPGYVWRPRADPSELRILLPLAGSSMMFPLSGAVGAQGVTLLVGAIASPAAVTAMTAYRTVSRVVLQATGLVAHSFWNEFSLLYGRGNIPNLRRAYWLANRLTFALAGAAVILVAALSPWVMPLWTRHTVTLHAPTLAIFMVASLFGAGWNVPRILLLATNKHSRLAFSFLLSSFLTLALLSIFMTVLTPVIASGLAILIGEALIAVWALHLVSRQFDEKWGR